MRFTSSIIYALLGCLVNSYKLRLDGDGWVWKGEGVEQFEGSVPGDVYTDLHRSGLIPDPYLNFNDVNLRWVSKQSWSIYKPFKIEYRNAEERVVLVVRGLDTVANVFINDHQVLSSSNMFHEHLVDVTDSLSKSGRNEIRVDFESPVHYAANQSFAYAQNSGYNVPPDCPPPTQSPECHVNFIRKMASSFSWDWGPAFPTMGIWKDIWLEITASCFIDRLSGVPVYDSNSDAWTVHAEAKIWCSQSTSANLRLSFPDIPNSWNSTVGLKTGSNNVYQTIVLHASKVKRWWPSGYGQQQMYIFQAELSSKGFIEPRSQTIALGFREVKLIQDPLAKGSTFYLTVNSVPIFLKGSNWIPTDAFLSTVTKDKLQYLFSSMAAANMNALRVWGGGVYESDDFYELADRHGILIWQDFMFAVNLYPSDSTFLASVRKEATDQLFRIKKHPSIAIWAGNNENELGLVGNWYHTTGTPGSSKQYRKDYLALYNETVWRVVNESDFSSRPYVLSSPSNGIDTIRQGGIASDAGSNYYGDIHYYNYNADAWTPKSFPTPRCATEFGYQSMPHFQTLISAIPNASDWQYFGSAMLHRQHHPFGNVEMLLSVLQHFPIPHCDSNDDSGSGAGRFVAQSVRKFAEVCALPSGGYLPESQQEQRFLRDMSYLTQLHQGMAYKTEVEHYRRWRNRTDPSTGLGNTMCALYWQLNDIWQAPSWSSIDYSLKWKPAHYFARKFFSPLLVSPYIDGDNLVVYTVSDELDELVNVTLQIDGLAGASDFIPRFQRSIRLPTIAPLSSAEQFHIPLRLIFNTPRVPDFFIVRTSLLTAAGTLAAPVNEVFPTRILHPENSGEVSVYKVAISGAHTFEVTVSSTGPTLFVWLDAGEIEGWWSDNAFALSANTTAVEFYPWSRNTTLAQFKAALTIGSIRDYFV